MSIQKSINQMLGTGAAAITGAKMAQLKKEELATKEAEKAASEKKAQEEKDFKTLSENPQEIAKLNMDIFQLEKTAIPNKEKRIQKLRQHKAIERNKLALAEMKAGLEGKIMIRNQKQAALEQARLRNRGV